jgi:hypothetical protein
MLKAPAVKISILTGFACQAAVGLLNPGALGRMEFFALQQCGFTNRLYGAVFTAAKLHTYIGRVTFCDRS